MEANHRGHKIFYRNNEWVYEDGSPMDDNCKCSRCGKESNPDGHDNCISDLKCVKNACCGHGIISEAYIQLLDDTVIRGEDAIIIQNILKKY
ncbi:MAG: hypothetical protein ACRDDY_04260 [Clostridium sp.]|uniref:hypothetical protein n=1 Tax=Clostridium sp. TaxID=1506 RepID=UPI003EE42511